MKIHKEGWLFISIFAAISLISLLLNTSLFLICTIITLSATYFFRDPIRILPDLIDDEIIISPADGLITDISIDEKEEKKHTRISIYLNVFDVHVMRIPISGKVTQKKYQKGTFAHAESPQALESNENMLIKIEGNVTIFVRQVAGMIARRIVCYLEKGDDVQIGKRYGIIKFGSRVDLYIPTHLKVLVKTGQTMIGGETIIAKVNK